MKSKQPIKDHEQETKPRWLIIDGDYLCHRAFHSIPSAFNHGEMRTNVIYGFFQAAMKLDDLFSPLRTSFCFDSRAGSSIRHQLFPDYKKERKLKLAQMNGDDKQRRKDLEVQIGEVWKFLHLNGHRSCYMDHLVEGDDLIASLVQSDKNNEFDKVIVTADKDMFQLISPTCVVHNPTSLTTMTLARFNATYGKGVLPLWASIKAVAGCPTDGVPGVKGVGEKTAISYFTGSMKKGTVTHQRIEKFMASSIYDRNLKLVSIPIEGCPPQTYTPRDETYMDLDRILGTYGISRLI